MSTLLHDRVKVRRHSWMDKLISFHTLTGWLPKIHIRMAGYSYTQGIGEGPCGISRSMFVHGGGGVGYHIVELSASRCCYVNWGYLLFTWGSLSAQYKLAYRVCTYDHLLISLSCTTPICTHIPGEQETVSWHQCHLRPGLLQLSAWQSAAGGRLRTGRQERQGTA